MLLAYVGVTEISILLVPIIGIFLAVLVGKYADSKGRSFWAGFLLSIFLSPLIGALIIALMSDNRGSNR